MKTKMPKDKMLKIRGKDIAMIFQEPMTGLNPVFKIGYQMDEVVCCILRELHLSRQKLGP